MTEKLDLLRSIRDTGELAQEVERYSKLISVVEHALAECNVKNVALKETEDFEQQQIVRLTTELHETKSSCNMLKREMRQSVMREVASLNELIDEEKRRLEELSVASQVRGDELSRLIDQMALEEEELFLIDAQAASEYRAERLRIVSSLQSGPSSLFASLRGDEQLSDDVRTPPQRLLTDSKQQLQGSSAQTLLTHQRLVNVLTALPQEDDARIDAFLCEHEQLAPTHNRTLRKLGEFFEALPVKEGEARPKLQTLVRRILPEADPERSKRVFSPPLLPPLPALPAGDSDRYISRSLSALM